MPADAAPRDSTATPPDAGHFAKSCSAYAAAVIRYAAMSDTTPMPRALIRYLRRHFQIRESCHIRGRREHAADS